MKDKSKLTAIILVIITLVVVISSFIFDNKNSVDETGKIKIVTNYSNFYTVNSCVYRAINYISSNNKENLLLILNDSYKKEKKINETNILNVFESIGENSTFVPKKMYYQEINENITKYYVYGNVQQNQIFDDGYTNKLDYKEMYLIVYLDTNNKTFSIEPYSKELFTNIGGDNNEG